MGIAGISQPPRAWIVVRGRCRRAPRVNVRPVTTERSRQATSEMGIRTTLDRHWAASAAGDLETEHDIYLDDAICDYPQSGERIRGRRNIQALRGHHPDKPSGFSVRRIVGSGVLWVTEYFITYQGNTAYNSEHHGVQWGQGVPRNAVLCRSIHGAGVAGAVGRANGVAMLVRRLATLCRRCATSPTYDFE